MENENVSKNFIEQFIDQDIEEGHCKTVHTRFPPEPNGYRTCQVHTFKFRSCAEIQWKIQFKI